MHAHTDGPDANFALLLATAAERWPQRTAVVQAGRHWSFAALWERSGAFAAAYRGAGAVAGDRICILLEPGGDAAAAFFGALSIGAIGCMLSETYRARQVTSIVSDLDPTVLVAAADASELLSLGGSRARALLDPTRLSSGAAPRVHRAAGAQAAQITYTSGSTDRAKGVVASHANLWAGAATVPRYLGIHAEDRLASLLPWSGVYGFNQLTCALATGASLIVERALLGRDILDAMRREAVTVIAGVPPTWMQLLHGGLRASPLPSLRIATCAGGRLAPAMVRELRDCQPWTALFLMYGLTEVFRSTYLDPSEVDAHPDAMGRPVPGSEVLVLRDDGTACEAGEVGQLIHRGPTVALGYWNDAARTESVFRSYRSRESDTAREVLSGDLVTRDANGLLRFVGRRDRMLKTLGYRAHPEEVTDVLLASQLVLEAEVTGEPDRWRGDRLVAHVVLRPSASLNELRRFCGLELPRYLHPAPYELYDALPRGATGKIDLQSLRRAVAEGE
jgi:acyl-CoA synthetase (AMP-forming)/AMP-acid ligase II